MQRKALPIIVLLLIAFVLTACIRPEPAASASMPNPASKNCVDKGGKFATVTLSTGEAGLCLFADGSLCDEWAFFDGKCQAGQNKPVGKPAAGAQTKPQLANPASVNCVDKGGQLLIVQARDGSEYGLCQLSTGKLCEEFAFLRGERKP